MALQQGGMQATQFASTIDGSIDCAGLFFLSKLEEDLCLPQKRYNMFYRIWEDNFGNFTNLILFSKRCTNF